MSLIKKKSTDNLVAWIPVPTVEGMYLQMRFISRKDYQALANKHQFPVYDKDLKQHVQKLDPENFRKAFIEKVVVGWKGLTYESLFNLVPVDVEATETELKTKGKTIKDDITFDLQLCIDLVSESYDLEKVITDACTDISKFQTAPAAKLESEIKN